VPRLRSSRRLAVAGVGGVEPPWINEGWLVVPTVIDRGQRQLRAIELEQLIQLIDREIGPLTLYRRIVLEREIEAYVERVKQW
jgi:hypothetical protein